MSLAVFKSEEFGTIRTESEGARVWFAAKDVANALGYSNASKAIGDHCKGVTKRYLPTEGGRQALSFIPESDVYRLIMRSKLASAERFQDWVVEDVLPALRAEGVYAVGTVHGPGSFSPVRDLIQKLSAFEIRKYSDIRTLAAGYELLDRLEGSAGKNQSLPAPKECAHTPAASMIVRSVAAEQLQHGRIAEAYSTAYLLRIYGGETGGINSVQLGIGLWTLVGVDTEFRDESGEPWVARIQPHRDRSARKWIVAIQGRKEVA